MIESRIDGIKLGTEQTRPTREALPRIYVIRAECIQRKRDLTEERERRCPQNADLPAARERRCHEPLRNRLEGADLTIGLFMRRLQQIGDRWTRLDAGKYLVAEHAA